MKKSELKNTRQFKAAKKKSEQTRADGSTIPYNYVNNVPLFWCTEYEITALQLFTYCFIRDCTKNMKERAYTGSVKGLCSRFFTSEPTQRKALDALVEKGFLFKEKSPYGQAQWVRYTDALARYWAKEDNRSIREILDANQTRLAIRKK
jgi:hypothetical protein